MIVVMLNLARVAARVAIRNAVAAPPGALSGLERKEMPAHGAGFYQAAKRELRLGIEVHEILELEMKPHRDTVIAVDVKLERTLGVLLAVYIYRLKCAEGGCDERDYDRPSQEFGKT